MIRLRDWFFERTKTANKAGTRFRNGDQPDQATFQDLVDSNINKGESVDRAKEDVGSFSSGTVGHVTLSTDTQAKSNESKKQDRSIVVQPSQLPTTTAGENISLGSGDLTYAGESVNVEIDSLITTRNSFKLKLADGVTSWLNSVYSSLLSLSQSVSSLVSQYDSLNVRVTQNTQAIEDLTGGNTTGETVGTIKPFLGSSAPSGYFLWDGSITEVSKANYANLYAIIGDSLGTPADTNNFVIWNSNWGNSKFSLRPHVNGDSSGSLFATGGSSSVNLQLSDIPEHTHGKGTLSTSESGGHTHTHEQFGFPKDGQSAFVGASTLLGISGVGGNVNKTNLSSQEDHTHTINGTTGNIVNKPSGTSVNIENPYLNVKYIIYHGVLS